MNNTPDLFDALPDAPDAPAGGGEPPAPPVTPLLGSDDALPLDLYAERAYLAYAMSVVKSRALPQVEDGLKPVQRRILFSMNEMRLAPGSKHVKSARVVGDVIGKYHRHPATRACTTRWSRSGGVAIDAVSRTPIAIADCVSKGFSIIHGIVNVPAMVLILVLTALLVVGIRESARFNNIIVYVKVAIVLLVIGFGFQYVNTANWTPFIPENTGEFGKFGWSGVLRGAGVIFFGFIGLDAVSTAAQEAKNPQKDLPIGILGSLAVCSVLYILMALVMTGIAHYTELNVPHPVFVAIEKAGPSLKWLGYLINIGAISGR